MVQTLIELISSILVHPTRVFFLEQKNICQYFQKARLGFPFIKEESLLIHLPQFLYHDEIPFFGKVWKMS